MTTVIPHSYYYSLNPTQTRARPCFSCRLGSGPQRARRAPATAVDRRAAPVGRLETSPPVAQEELASWAVPTLCPACKGSRGVQPHKYYNTLKPGKKSSHSYAMLFCKTVKGPPWPSGPPAAAGCLKPGPRRGWKWVPLPIFSIFGGFGTFFGILGLQFLGPPRRGGMPEPWGLEGPGAGVQAGLRSGLAGS